MMVVGDIPGEIDYSEFKWLRKGDLPRVKQKAQSLGSTVTISMIRHTLKKRAFNLDVLVAAQMLVNEKKSRLLQLQAEGQRLSRLIQMKVA